METRSRTTRRRLPSPAMVVAAAALFVALGGTGYAVTSLPKNSVGTPQLRNNAVTSVKVRNGTLVAADFKAGQLKPGPAGPAGAAGAAGPAGPPGPAGTGATVAFATKVEDSPVTVTSSSLTDIGSATINVPAGTTATLVATFSAESLCNGATGWCSVRVFVDGTEMNPEDGSNYAFDSPVDSGPPDYEAHSVTRVRTGIGAGDHTVVVRAQVVNTASSLRLDDWALFVQAFKQS